MWYKAGKHVDLHYKEVFAQLIQIERFSGSYQTHCYRMGNQTANPIVIKQVKAGISYYKHSNKVSSLFFTELDKAACSVLSWHSINTASEKGCKSF